MLQVLDALGAAHAKGIVHRDLKPSNIMIADQGTRRNALVLDFGIGTLASAAERITHSGETLGTTGYGAPEQWRGLEATPSSDLFAWGLVMLECLSGKPVYGGSHGDALFQLLSPEEVPVPPSVANHPLGALLRRVLEKDPAKRTVTALDAIAALDEMSLPGVSNRAGDHAPVAASQTVSNRVNRRVAMVFARVSSSSKPGASPAEEDAATSTVAASLEERGGRVVAALGDAMLAVWGYPVADERDPMNAVRAALAARDVASRLPDVAVGFALDYDMLPSDARHVGLGAGPARALRRLVGEPRMVVSETLERMVREGADIERAADGALQLRGLRAPSDSDARVRAPFVGRETEINLVVERWGRASAGAGECCLVTGEPGIGKSRILAELQGRIQTQDHTRVEVRCAPETRHVLLAPVIDAIVSTLDDADDAPGSRRAERLSELCRRARLDDDTTAITLQLAGLPLGDRKLPDVSPQKAREQGIAALEQILLHPADDRPLLLMVEDLHWADETTLDLLGKLVGSAPSAKCLLLMTARPEFAPQFATSVVQLPLTKLDRADVVKVAEAIAGERPLSREALNQVLDRTDGVPLFIEELTRELVEQAAQGGASAVPVGLQALLAARLDRVGEARETARVASVLGREFDEALLFAVSPVGADGASAHVDRLVRTGLMSRRRQGRERMLVFKHALIRDAAYESIPEEQRRELHGRVAATIEEKFPDVAEARPALLATHLAASRQETKAVPLATKAAERALARSAYAETIAESSRALEWAAALDGEARVFAELAANAARNQALMAQRGWVDPEVKRGVDRSAALLKELGPATAHPATAQRVPFLWALFSYHHTAGNRREAEAAARDAVALAELTGDPGLRASALTLLGIAREVDGASAESMESLDKAIALYRPDVDRNQGRLFGLDSLVLAKALRSHFYWHEGEWEKAQEIAASAISWAREIDHTPSLALGLLYCAQTYQFAGDKATVAAMSGEILGLSARFGLPAFEGYAVLLHGWATGNEAASDQLIGILQGLGCRLLLSYYGALRADALSTTSPERAIRILDESLALCDAMEERMYEAELLRRRAALMESDDLASAMLERAEHVARGAAQWTSVAEVLRDLQKLEDPNALHRLGALIDERPGVRRST